MTGLHCLLLSIVERVTEAGIWWYSSSSRHAEPGAVVAEDQQQQDAPGQQQQQQNEEGQQQQEEEGVNAGDAVALMSEGVALAKPQPWHIQLLVEAAQNPALAVPAIKTCVYIADSSNTNALLSAVQICAAAGGAAAAAADWHGLGWLE
jgi:hypothetical protein